MKIKLFLTVSLLSIGVLFGQNLKVPANINDSFKKLYPDVKSVKWEKEDKNSFEANFVNNGVKTSIVLDNSGNLMETEIVISSKEAPEQILKYVAENFKDSKIKEVCKITDSKGKINYEIEIQKGKKKKDLIFDENNNIVKKNK
jgi:hypothetical protein